MASSPGRIKPVLSNDEQLWLMQQVKLNAMTIDEAVTWTESRENELKVEMELRHNAKEKLNSSSHRNQFKPAKVLKNILNKKTTPRKSESEKLSLDSNEDGQDGLTAFAHDLKNKKIYNFSVYKCAKAKSPQKRILQVDFDGKLLSLIHRGNITKAHPFASIVSVDGQEGKKVFMYFDEAHELEINTENLVDKTKLIRLLNIICEQNEYEERGEPFDPCEKLQLSFKVIKEGFLEKKGGYTALNWNKRLVVIRAGELAYYRVDEEEQSAALNIIHLSPGSIAINAEDSNTFTIATTKESHRFRISENGPSLACSQEKLRDEWIDALQEGCKRHYQKTSSSEEESGEEVEEESEEEVVATRDSFDVIMEELEKLKSSYSSQENNNSSSEMREKISTLEALLHELKKSSKKREASSKSKASMQSNRLASIPKETPILTSPPSDVIEQSKEKEDHARVQSLVESLIINTEQIALETHVETHQYTSLQETTKATKPDANGHITLLNDDVFVDEEPYAVSGAIASPIPSVASPFSPSSAVSVSSASDLSASPAVCTAIYSEVSLPKPTVKRDSEADNKSLASIPTPPPSVGFIPPPPPSGGVMPPLPPPPMSPQTKAEPKVQMRPFHWQTVSKQLISKSIWKNMDDYSEQINHDELLELFQLTNDKKPSNSTSTPSRVQVLPTETPKKRALESYLDHKTAQNLGIFMAGFKLRGEELVRKLAIINVDDGGISTEQVSGLRKFCPEPELKALYAKHEGREEELAKVDRFMLELCNIPRLSTRLEILATIRELPQEIEALNPEVDLALRACHELLESKLFETLLAYILTVGNLINASNTKGTTKGIRLSTLQKTYVMRTNDRKKTFLQVVLQIVKRNAPQVLELQREMTSLSKAQSYSTKGLLAEIDIMRKNVVKVRKSCDLLKRKKYHPTKEDLAFCSEAETSLAYMESCITQLNEKCMEIKRTVTKVLVKFGESPDTDSQEIFTAVREFLDNFRKSLPP